MPPERAASTPNPGDASLEVTHCFARVSALRSHDESTALQVV